MSALEEFNAHRSWTKQRGQEYVRGDFSDAAINELLAEVERLKKEALHQYERYVAEQERTIVANQRAEAAEAELADHVRAATELREQLAAQNKAREAAEAEVKRLNALLHIAYGSVTRWYFGEVEWLDWLEQKRRQP